jgi:transposase
MATIRSNTLRIVVSREEAVTCRVLGERVSRLYNAGNYLCRQAFLAGRPIPSYALLCRRLPLEYEADYRALPSDIAQEVIKKLGEAWQSFRALRKAHTAGTLRQKPGLPRYRKNRDGSRPFDFNPIKSARSYDVADTVTIALPADLRKKGRLSLKYVGCERYRGARKRAELMWDKARQRWYLKYAVEVADKVIHGSNRGASIDLGVRIAASLSVEGVEQARNFSAREMLKDWDYWSRQIAQHMQELAGRGRKTSRRLSRLFAMRSARWRHAWQAIACEIASTCRRRCIGTVYIGWPKGIREDRVYSKKWAGRIHNFWGFDASSRILQTALERQGIMVKRAGERGSSSTCPVTACGSKNVVRKPRHVLACRACGTVIHSDQAGSRNILALNHPGTSWDAVKTTVRPDTLCWNKQRWGDAENRNAKALLKAA